MCRWKDIKIRYESVDRIHMDQDGDQWCALVNTVMCEPEGSLHNELLGSIEGGEFLNQLSAY
jgi:hypothetical protein